METQLEKAIKKKIEVLRSRGSDMILSESEIARELGVDRHSVRRAIRKCSRIGMLHPIRGKGYAVNIDEMVVNISSTTNYTDGQLKRHKQPRAEIIDYSLVQPRNELSRFFDEKVHERVWLIRFKRFMDDIPFSTTRSYLSFKGFEDINLHLQENHSLYRVLRGEYGIWPKRIWSTCEAESADPEISRILRIPGGLPLLKVCSLANDQNNSKVVEYCETYFRADLVKVKFEIEQNEQQED